MRTLSIGNSFSQDACAYLHQAAGSAGLDLECVNLYIGGCSLAYHAENLRENRENYALEINGTPTGRQISIPEALALNLADNADAKLETMREIIKAAGDNNGWLGYNKLFESNLRKSSEL